MLLALSTLALLASLVYTLPTLLQDGPARTSIYIDDRNDASEVSIETTVDDSDDAVRRHRYDFEPSPESLYTSKDEFPLFLNNLINWPRDTYSTPSEDHRSKDKVHDYIHSQLAESLLVNEIHTPKYPTPASFPKLVQNAAVPKINMKAQRKFQHQKIFRHITELVAKIMADLNPK